MKNFFSAFISLILFPILTFGQQSNVNDLSKFEGIVTTSEFSKVKILHPIARRAITNQEVAGEFKNVTYKLAPNVKVLSDEQKRSLKMASDGILDRTSMSDFNPDPALIYLDREGEYAFQAQPVDDKRMMMLKPKLSSIFEDLNIPPQEVALTLANTAEADPKIETTSSKTEDDYLLNFVFKDYKIVLDSLGKSGCFVTLNGNISLTNPKIEASYTKNNGYRIVFKAGELLNLKADMNIKLKNEQKMLLWGGYVQIPELGKCEVAVYLALTMEGNVTLKVDMSHGFNLQLGVRGSTFWYAPTSFKNISNYSLFNEMDAEMVLDAKAFAGVMCNANMRIFGLKLLDINFSAGLEATGKIEDDKISAEMGLRASSVWKLLHLKKTMFDKYILMLEYEKPNYAGYDIVIHEVCAFGDYVAGEIKRVVNGDTLPYNGPLTLLVRQGATSQQASYPAQTDNDGIFIATDVPLRSGSKVAVKIPGVTNATPDVDASIPFREIKLYHADYYAGVAEGSLSAVKSKWYKLATSRNSPPNSNLALQSIRGSGGIANIQNSSAFSRSEKTKRISDFMANMLEYRGPVEFVSQSGGHANMSSVSTQKGGYEVRNMDFVPGDMIKARVNIEGFILESDWIETDGLVISDIESEGLLFGGNHLHTIVSATKSFVLVTPIRGTNPPQGIIKLLKGMNLSDPLPAGEKEVVSAFPDARNAVIFFDRTVSLTQLPGNPSAGIAETGPWNKAYSLPNISASVFKCNRPFEQVSFTYKDKETGYSFIMEPCGKINTPQLHNMFDAINSSKLQNTFKKIEPKKVAPKFNPIR